ncbi:hypothetical protein K470DRAFT_267101 [Piedraia hortae CBS 480.64]|uniref:Uncharacterized protein n=1 Tax=Piedraia hortae CBS 480.64 TaxID=1314780 RepID=A0A6A7BPC7_9PEZI|nr:hypothetical protein K470DRAFT_267101 [Piedraia hortae CBS 480.64]
MSERISHNRMLFPGIDNYRLNPHFPALLSSIPFSHQSLSHILSNSHQRQWHPCPPYRPGLNRARFLKSTITLYIATLLSALVAVLLISRDLPEVENTSLPPNPPTSTSGISCFGSLTAHAEQQCKQGLKPRRAASQYACAHPRSTRAPPQVIIKTKTFLVRVVVFISEVVKEEGTYRGEERFTRKSVQRLGETLSYVLAEQE